MLCVDPSRHRKYPKRFDMLIESPMMTKIIHWNLKPNKAVRKKMTHMAGATKRPIQNSLASAFPPKFVAKESRVEVPSRDSKTHSESPFSLM